MARGPQGERGPQGPEGPEGPRGGVSLWAGLAILLVGMGMAAGFIVSGIIGSEDEQDVLGPKDLLTANPGEFGTPGSPQVIQNNSAWNHYDVQIHNRDNFSQWDGAMGAQHGSDCSAPPASHSILALDQSVYICNDHFMTASNAAGYGEVVVTPSQIVNCSAGCTVQFDMSTLKMSGRDWPDVWLTPWADNLTLPFDAGDVDLQGVPRQGIHVSAAANQGGWTVSTINNYVETALYSAFWDHMGIDIDPSVNQAAARQTFKLTVLPGQVKFERLASSTAPSRIWTVDPQTNQVGFTACACLLASDYVVQFAQHSYNPTKDNSGVPATWHWSGINLSNASPFTLIHATPKIVTTNGATVTFNSPTPANAYLRFSGLGKISTDAAQQGVMAVAPKQTFVGHYEHASNYFIPIQAGRTSVNVSFASDDWVNCPCAAQDFHVWSKVGGPAPTPVPATPTPLPQPTATPIPQPSPTPIPNATPTPAPTATIVPPPTPLPVPTGTPPVPPPTATPTGPRNACTLRWGNGTIEQYGQLTQAECAARGN